MSEVVTKFKGPGQWRSQAAALEAEAEVEEVHMHMSGGIEFACHDASCRPPGSGGTGGSRRGPAGPPLSRVEGRSAPGTTEFGKRINAMLDSDPNIRYMSKGEVDSRHAKKVESTRVIDQDDLVRQYTVGNPAISHQPVWRTHWHRNQEGFAEQIAREDAASAEMKDALGRVKQIRHEDYEPQNESERVLQNALDKRLHQEDIYAPVVVNGDFGEIKLTGAPSRSNLQRNGKLNLIIDDAVEQSVNKIGHEIRNEIERRHAEIDQVKILEQHTDAMIKINHAVAEAYGGEQYAHGVRVHLNRWRDGEVLVSVTPPQGGQTPAAGHPVYAEIKRLAREAGVTSDRADDHFASVMHTEHQRILHEVLSEVTQLGGALKGTPNARKMQFSSKLNSHDQVVAAVKRYPENWIEASNENTPLGFRQTKGRAHYQHTDGKGGSEITLDGSIATATHEFAHRFERTVPGVLGLEARFYDRRTAGESLVPMGKGYGKNEKTREDKFFERYAGKTYNDTAYELLSMGYEHLQTKRGWDRIDDDYKAFVLGTIVSAYRG